MSGPVFVKFLKEDEHFFVVAKPEKCAVHPSEMCRDRRTLLHMVRNKGGGKHVYPVHRLDKPVSGPVLFARSSAMVSPLQQQFVNRQVRKHYLAIVRGWIGDAGVINHPLKKHATGAMLDCLSEFECLGRAELNEPFGIHKTVRYSLVKLSPVSGRFHQLRRHCRDIAHPILGDSTDGDSHQNRFFREKFSLRRLMLHCYFLGFDHPSRDQRVETFLAPNRDFMTVIEKLGWTTTFQNTFPVFANETGADENIDPCHDKLS
jgi:tRNA pseudouridine65 synthase